LKPSSIENKNKKQQEVEESETNFIFFDIFVIFALDDEREREKTFFIS